MAFTGLLQVGLQLGLDAILVKPKRQIGDFVAHVTIQEEHHDELEVTQQPVEQGAAITDHAFKKPARLVVIAGWSNSPNSNAVGGSSSLLGSLAGAVTGTIGGVADLFGQAGESLGSLPEAIGQLSDTVTRPLSAAGEFVSNAVNQVTDGVITTVAGGFQEAFGAVSAPLGGLGGSLEDAIGGFADDFSGGLEGLSSSLSGDNVGQVREVYARFLELQASREPFEVFTGKRVYQDMLVTGIATKTNKETENSLFLRIEMQQVIIVATAQAVSVTSDQSAQAEPEDTSPTVNIGEAQLSEAPNYNEEAGNEAIGADPPGEEFA